MNWITGIETAVEYIENNLTEKLDYEKIASSAYCSSYHFQRMFSVLAGCTLGEYIRNRRMTLAGSELKGSDIKVLELAVKYCYESSESFSRAFTKFHGITPSAARKTDAKLKSFSRLSIYDVFEGGNIIDYQLIERDEQTFFAYKQRFEGTPYSRERYYQEQELFNSTRSRQWMLKGVSSVCSQCFNDQLDYCIIDNIDDSGYDFYYAQPISSETGVMPAEINMHKIVLPKATYAVFKTQRERYPNDSYMKICRQIFCEWLPSTNYRLAKSPELIIYHWYNENKNDRYIEILVPINI